MPAEWRRGAFQPLAVSANRPPRNLLKLSLPAACPFGHTQTSLSAHPRTLFFLSARAHYPPATCKASPLFSILLNSTKSLLGARNWHHRTVRPNQLESGYKKTRTPQESAPLQNLITTIIILHFPRNLQELITKKWRDATETAWTWTRAAPAA